VSAVQVGSRAASRRPPPVLSALVVVSGILAPAFGAFITATVLPSAIAEIGGLATYAWASTAYAVGSILGSAGSPVVALRVDTRRGVFLATGVFVAGAAVCATAPSMPVVVAGRGVQGLGIGTCWAHIGTAILSSARPDEGALTASMIPSTQLFAVALGAALSGVIANAAGLAAGAWLFGCFVAAPLAAVVIASRLRPAR
jgi:MFS family permease